MTREEAIQHLLEYAEKVHWVSDGTGLLGGWITAALSSPWISVKDRLPEDGQLIVYADNVGRGYVYGVIYYPEPPLTDMMDYWMPLEEIKEN